MSLYHQPNRVKMGARFLTPFCLHSILEKKLIDMEEQKQVDLKTLREQKEQLETLILRQTAIIGQMEEQLIRVSSNNTVLQQQQQELLDTVNGLIQTISAGPVRGQATRRWNGKISDLQCQTKGPVWFLLREQKCHDAGHSNHIHGLCCRLQVRQHPEWNLHPHITQHYYWGQGTVRLSLLSNQTFTYTACERQQGQGQLHEYTAHTCTTLSIQQCTHTSTHLYCIEFCVWRLLKQLNKNVLRHLRNKRYLENSSTLGSQTASIVGHC